MADIFLKMPSKRYVFVKEKSVILIQLSLNVVPNGSVASSNDLARNRWQTLPEPMLTKITDATMS